MTDAEPPEVVARLRPDAGRGLLVVYTLVVLAVAVLLVVFGRSLMVSLIQVAGLVGMVLYGWVGRRREHQHPERLWISTKGITVSWTHGRRWTPWSEVGELRWQPPGTVRRLLGGRGRLSMVLEAERRVSEQAGVRVTAHTVPLGGLDLTPAQVLQAIAAHAPASISDGLRRDPPAAA